MSERAEKVLRLAEEKGLADRIIYSSFNHYSMRRIKRLLPTARTAFLYCDGILDIAEYAEKYGAFAVYEISGSGCGKGLPCQGDPGACLDGE